MNDRKAVFKQNMLRTFQINERGGSSGHPQLGTLKNQHLDTLCWSTEKKLK